MNLYERLVTLLPDVPVTALSPLLSVCYNLGTLAFFIFLLRIVELLVHYPSKHSRWSWGALLGVFVFGRAMTTMQLVLGKGLVLSLELSLLAGVVVAGITYLLVPLVVSMLTAVYKK
jgi:hypothetical protein